MPPTRRSEKNEEISDHVDDTVKTKFDEKQADRWVFILNDEIIQHDANVENRPAICALKHPKSETKALYLFTNEEKDVYEIKKFREEYRSWFIGNSVQSDGSLYVTTPMDPVFLLLPYLITAEKAGKFMTLDQIVVDEDFPECHRLHNTTLTDIDYVTDSKGDEDFKAYRYNAEKTLSWLKLKTEQVVVALKRSNISPSGAHCAELIKSNKEKVDEDEYLRYAFGIVSDYIPLHLSTSLQEYLGIPAITDKRPTDSLNPPAKRAKLEDITPLEDYSKNVAPEIKPTGKQSAAQKKLDKVDKKGMKSMMSFFSPKPK